MRVWCVCVCVCVQLAFSSLPVQMSVIDEISAKDWEWMPASRLEQARARFVMHRVIRKQINAMGGSQLSDAQISTNMVRLFERQTKAVKRQVRGRRKQQARQLHRPPEPCDPRHECELELTSDARAVWFGSSSWMVSLRTWSSPCCNSSSR